MPQHLPALFTTGRLVARCSWSFRRALFDRLVGAAASRRGAHDLVDANFERPAVIGRHATADVAFGDNANQLAAYCILNHRRAAAT